MATPKEMVDARLKELKWSKARLMKELGYQTGFQDYYNLFVAKPHQLTDQKLEQIAAVLGRPTNWLKARGEESARKREHYIRAEFDRYLHSDIGKKADPETHRILSSMQWTGKWLPSERLYIAVQAVMEGTYTAAELLDSMVLEIEDRKVPPVVAVGPEPAMGQKKRARRSP